MKVVVTGATGFVGGAVLSRLLLHPDVDQVTCITRRPLPITSSKLVVLMHEDFAVWDDSVLERLADHSGCIWALGGKSSALGTGAQLELVTHTFTIAFAGAVAARVGTQFRFCYVSGMGADPDERAWFPWERQTRHLKGRTERDLVALAERSPRFEVYSFRPGGILPPGTRSWVHRALAPWVIEANDLADALALGVTGKLGKGRTLCNQEMKRVVRNDRVSA